MTALTIRIVGHTLPGRRCRPGSDADGTGKDNVHVGVQRGREVIDLVAGDAAEAVFELQVTVAAARAGGTDFRGPYVHGKPGERFLYLSWGLIDDRGRFEMFRRAKLHLSTIERGDLQRALDFGTVIEAHLPLTDRCGDPICASVRPPTLVWRVSGTQASAS